MIGFINYYEVLHVIPNAPIEIIKLAYKGLAQKYHPDRYQGLDANQKMQLLNEALEVLSTPHKRKDFDDKLNLYNIKKQQERDFFEYQKRKDKEDPNNKKKGQNTSKSYSDAQSSSNGSNEDPQNINININISFPKIFSILKPFTLLTDWIKTHYRSILKSVTGLVGIIVGVSIIFLILDKVSKTNDVAVQEESYTSYDKDEHVYENPYYDKYEDNGLALATAAASAAANAAADSASAAADSLDLASEYTDGANITSNPDNPSPPDLHTYDSNHLNLSIWINKENNGQTFTIDFSNTNRPELNSKGTCSYSHGGDESLVRYSTLIKKQLSIDAIYNCTNEMTAELSHFFNENSERILIVTLSNSSNTDRVYYSGQMVE